jgi:acetate kinase
LSLHLVNGDTVHDIALKAAVTENLHEVLDETLNWFARTFR